MSPHKSGRCYTTGLHVPEACAFQYFLFRKIIYGKFRIKIADYFIHSHTFRLFLSCNSRSIVSMRFMAPFAWAWTDKTRNTVAKSRKLAYLLLKLSPNLFKFCKLLSYSWGSVPPGGKFLIIRVRATLISHDHFHPLSNSIDVRPDRFKVIRVFAGFAFLDHLRKVFETILLNVIRCCFSCQRQSCKTFRSQEWTWNCTYSQGDYKLHFC